jgi:protein-serine/threonine kinase
MSAIPRLRPDDDHDDSTDCAATTRSETRIHTSPRKTSLRTTTSNGQAFAQNATLPPSVDTAIPLPHRSTIHLSPASAGLSLKTDVQGQATSGAAQYNEPPTISYGSGHPADSASIQTLPASSHIATMDSSLRSNVSMSSLTSSLSPGSNPTLPSPYLAAMADLTPLPSPIQASDTVWRRRHARSIDAREDDNGNLLGRPHSQPTSPESPTKRKKAYGSLMHEAAVANATSMAAAQEIARSTSHTRNRSISDFVPEQLHNVRPRHVTFGEGDAPSLETPEYHMQREAYLAAQRGLTATAPPLLETSKQLPTPPASSSSISMGDEAEEELPHLEDGTPSDFLEIHCGIHNKIRKFRQLRQLGQGTFSVVMLATRENITAHPTPEIEAHLDPRKLVAVKILEHGPAGGADEERIETSLKREVEILKSISHPSLVHLKACEYQASRTLLVLSYCPGGDLFDFATKNRELLTPPLIQRMFAELVSAVRYLHTEGIVHRDIKLENVLVNLSESAVQALTDPTTHPTPIVTLTDLGLSRRIPEPPESPLLTTRCGSEDYAAPEILLGQPYDGRLTDAWALGVLLYALLEGRLPFDAPPGKPVSSRNTHRIARCDWIWCRFGDEDGDWDPARGKDFEGAQFCVEGLLKKVRMGRKPLDQIEKLAWVQDGINVPGGLRDDDDEVLG